MSANYRRVAQLKTAQDFRGYLALLGIGLWRLWPWKREVWSVVALIAYAMLLHALSYADMRFSLIVMPLVCVIAAEAL